MRKYIPILLFFTFLFNGSSGAVTSTSMLTAKSWLVADSEGKIISSENIDAVRSIASVTKLITAIAVLDSHAPLDKPLNIKAKVTRKKKTKEVSTPYDNSTRRQLIELAIVRSDNHAARLLCETYPGGYEECIRAMNRKMLNLGMLNSQVFDPTGLDDRNVSTARDLIKLAQAAVDYPEIVAASRLSQIKIKINKRWFQGRNTNPLIGDNHEIQVSKTGWTTRSGGCIVMLMDTNHGRRVIVVLGSRSIKTRIPEAEFISQIDETQASPVPPESPEETMFRFGNLFWRKSKD